MLKLIVSSFLLHVIFLLSVFDIYFRTTISDVNESHSYTFKPPAKRLVFFVVDGLRAQSIYNYSFPKNNPIRHDLQANYIKKIISNDAPWGIAHTRVPTESRPGHVALLAGFYEDPSAVTKGWKENPVDFDTVLNQTREAWCWGAPDIINMFSKGTSHVHTYPYRASRTEFDKNHTQELDDWVFNKTTKFFKSAEKDIKIKSRLLKDNIMFFLHLLGTDTAGHTFKPSSLEYFRNVEAVDRGIEKIVEMTENFYNHDNQTAYVLTSDHGMSEWGAHGSGHPHEIDCPVIAWGAGVSLLSLHVHTIGNLYRPRTDIKQADIAVLLSNLIGVGIPTNSIGVLPEKFLNFTKYQLAEAYFTNVKQILSLYNAKRAEKTKLEYFKSFEPLTEKILNDRMKKIQTAITKKYYDSAINQCKELIDLGLEGIQFYQNYYQTPILAAISISIILWILVLLELVIRDTVEYEMGKYVMAPRRLTNSIFWLLRNKVTSCILVLTAIIISSSSIIHFNLPPMCHIYFALPILLMECLYLNFSTWRNAFKILSHQDRKQNQQLIFMCIFSVILIEALIEVFFYRWVLSILIFVIGIWDFVYTRQVFNVNLFLMWFTSCGLLAVFPLLPVIGNNSNVYILICGGFCWLTAAFILFHKHSFLANDKISLIIKRIEIGFLIMAILLSFLFRSKLIHDNDRSKMQFITWIISGISIIIPFFNTPCILERLLHITFTLSVPFILLSVTYEPLFLITLSFHLLTWLRIESRVAGSIRSRKLDSVTNDTLSDLQQVNILQFSGSSISKESSSLRMISVQDFRHAFCYLFYLLLSFFGIGNIASINSFDPMWVVCYVSVFQPFLMTALILFKTIIIFLIVSCFLRAINIIANISFQKLLLIILTYSNIMILNFLYYVKNVGSWLEIGTSISQYVIIEAMAIIVIVLYYISVYYTSISIRSKRYELKY